MICPGSVKDRNLLPKETLIEYPSKTLNHRVPFGFARGGLRGARGDPGPRAGAWLIEVIQNEGARIQLIDVLLVGEHQGTGRSGGGSSGTEGLAKKN
jgi:hypothetical protein